MRPHVSDNVCLHQVHDQKLKNSEGGGGSLYFHLANALYFSNIEYKTNLCSLKLWQTMNIPYYFTKIFEINSSFESLEISQNDISSRQMSFKKIIASRKFNNQLLVV